MKTTKILALLAALCLLNFAGHAITNTVIAVSGTNIALSWPSSGYESYLVQYRQTLDATDSWSSLTNAYPASTNHTTYTIYGVIPPPSTNSGGGGGGNSSPPSPDEMNGSMSGSITTAASEPPMPMVIPANGSGAAVPLEIYPPDFDLSEFIIFDPATGEQMSGRGYVISSAAATPAGGFQPMDDPSGNTNITTGFYRVFQIPDWLADITNYVFDGPTFIPVDYATPDAPVDYVDNTTVLINGQPTDEAVFTPYVYQGVTNWGMGIYFDRFANGTNTIQLLTTVRQSGVLNDQTPYIVFSNAPQTITISNFVTYTNWSDLILSNTYTFNAQSTATNVDWEIDIYDVYDDFVNSQTGHSVDGNISWTWNLTDFNGDSRNDDGDPFFYPYLTITDGSGDPSGWMPPAANKFPSDATWLFAYLDKFYDDGTSNYVGADYYYTNAIHLMEGGPDEWEIGAWDCPIKYGRTYSQAERDASWGTLETNYLQSWNIRNFYYFGHGSSTTIGGDENVLDSSNNITASTNFPGGHAYLTSGWVLANVTANKSYGAIPFRFVFLDGCDTAVGNWPAAWEVPAQAETLSYYTNAVTNPKNLRPSAFVGWDTEIGGRKDWGTIDKFWEFRKDWMAEWAGTENEQLDDSFITAFQLSNWVSTDHDSHLKEYGYKTMRFQEYNDGGEWPQ
jgi:hypothetical protein